jgi:hypothetical protein
VQRGLSYTSLQGMRLIQFRGPDEVNLFNACVLGIFLYKS